MSKTIVLCNPFGTDVTNFINATFGVPQLLNGSVMQSGDTLYTLPYNNHLSTAANITAAAALLNTKLLALAAASSQPILVFSYSEGCEVADLWITQNAAGVPVPAGQLSFLSIGNPNSKYGGAFYNTPNFAPLGFGGGLPASVPWTYTIFTRQYDPIGDFPQSATIQQMWASLGVSTANPNYASNALAELYNIFTDTTLATACWNIAAGLTLCHNDYFTVTPQDPANLRFTDSSGVLYVLSPTFPVPQLQLALSTDATQDITLRGEIESFYSRIFGAVTLPAPPIHAVPASISGIAAPPAPAPAAPPVTQQQIATIVNRAELDALNSQLLHGNLATSAEAAEQLAVLRSTPDPEWVVTVYDNLWRPVAPVGGDMIDLTGTDPRNNLPSATLKIQGSSTLIDHFMGCRTTMVGVTVETAGLRFPFYVDTFDYEFKDDAWVGTANLKGIWDILNFYQIWPDWFLPIQAQVFSHAVFIGPLCTCIEAMIATCSIRIQQGINEFLNNVLSLNFDMRTWFGALLQSNGNIAEMLKTPAYVVRHDPNLDTSPLLAKTVRMESCGAVITDITRPYGVDTRVDLWLPGDPQPDQWTRTIPSMSLDQPTYVISTQDRSQITGPTKTVLDSVIRTVVDLEGSLLGNALDPLLNPTAADTGNLSPLPEGMFIAPALGVDFVAPWAILVAPEPGKKGSVETCKITNHTPKGWQHIIGGRSPKWLNDLMNATYSYIIDSISILIGFTGIPSNLLDGFLNNIFLAFQLCQHYTRRSQVGPYHPAIEVFHATATSPYNIETVFAFINALWDSRGYTCAITTIRNGEVYTLGKDIFRGGLVSLLYHSRTKMYTDYIENVMFHISETTRDLMIVIGDGRALEAPLAKHDRFLTGVFESINVLTLAPQS